MDNAVALVQAYLYANGYLTVTEYPVLQQLAADRFQVATDIDVLAIRLPGSGGVVPAGGARARRFGQTIPDPALGTAAQGIDFIVGEVKEGRAELNKGATDRHVLTAVLERFACCPSETLPPAVEGLIRGGRAVVRRAPGMTVRLVAFGSTVNGTGQGRFVAVSLGQVVTFLQHHLQLRWDAIRHAQIKDPAFGFLALLEKAKVGKVTKGE